MLLIGIIIPYYVLVALSIVSLVQINFPIVVLLAIPLIIENYPMVVVSVVLVSTKILHVLLVLVCA